MPQETRRSRGGNPERPGVKEDSAGDPHQQTQDAILADGSRIGRYLLLRDADGCLYALTAGAVAALCQCEGDGCLLLLPGGRMLRTNHPLARVLVWLT